MCVYVCVCVCVCASDLACHKQDALWGGLCVHDFRKLL